MVEADPAQQQLAEADPVMQFKQKVKELLKA